MLAKIVAKWMPAAPVDYSGVMPASELDILNVVFPFLVLAVGAGAGLAVFLAERLAAIVCL